jgi:hypothetical protein
MLLAICVHLPLLSLFLSKQVVNEAEWRERPAMLWISPPPVVPGTQSGFPAATVLKKVVPPTKRPSAKPQPAPAPETFFPAPASVAELLSGESKALAAKPSPMSADEIMRNAKVNIAGISRELSKEFPGRDKAPLSTPRSRLELIFAEAHSAARPDWYQAAKVEEISSSTSGGARIYRVVSALGTFCVTYPKDGGKPSYSTCP